MSDVEIGPQHEQLISELYALRERIEMSRDEQLILDMAIQMIEYLDDRLQRVAREQLLNIEKLPTVFTGVDAARHVSKIRFTFEDFERLVCSGGFELIDGRLEPR